MISEEKRGDITADLSGKIVAKLCMECALAEREYRDMHADELRRRNDARRQRKCNGRKRRERE